MDVKDPKEFFPSYLNYLFDKNILLANLQKRAGTSQAL